MTSDFNEAPLIDGATRIYGIIGDPIAQVGSPRVFTGRFRAAGINAVMIPLHVLPARFDETVRALMALVNLDGIVITVPYKTRIIPFVDQLRETAKQVGAVNAMRREPDGTWTGDMFDGRGLVSGLKAHDFSVDDRRVMLIGAGGAGSAVAFAIAEAGAAALTLFDVDSDKAAGLAARVSVAYPECIVQVGPPTTTGQDLLINATPTGMGPGDGLPGPFGEFDPDLFVVDVITKPEVTPLLRHAQSCGCRTMGGRYMLEGQANEMMRFFGPGG
jgi:shikimate dehydrogenase